MLWCLYSSGNILGRSRRHTETRSCAITYIGWEFSEHHNTVDGGFVKMTWIKFKRYWAFYFGSLLSIPLVAIPKVLLDRRIRFLLIVIAITAVGVELENWSHPHYIAPLTVTLLAVLLQCMRHLQFGSGVTGRLAGQFCGQWCSAVSSSTSPG